MCNAADRHVRTAYVNTEDVRNSASISFISNYAVRSSLFVYLHKNVVQIQLHGDFSLEKSKMRVRLAAHEALIDTYLYRTNDNESALYAWRNS